MIPPNVSKARAKWPVSNLKEISAKNVTSHELRQAKVLLLRDIPSLRIQRRSRRQRGWLSRSVLGSPARRANPAPPAVMSN